jgi:hypothetical protein
MDECNKVHSIPENDKGNNGKGKQMSVRSIISDYGERTTFHGFRYFILGGSFIRQLIWLGFILCSFAYFTFNGIRLFTNFFNFPTTLPEISDILRRRSQLPPFSGHSLKSKMATRSGISGKKVPYDILHNLSSADYFVHFNLLTAPFNLQFVYL